MSLFKLAWRNVLRNKVRLALTVMGVAIAVMTFVTLRTALASWEHASDVVRKDRLVTRQKLTSVIPVPKRYVDELRDAKDASGAPLVQAATWETWFGGRVPDRERDFFATMAIDPASFFDVFTELTLTQDAIASFKSDRNGALIGDVLARHMNWHVGERVNLKSPIFPSPDDAPWTFTVRGIYSTTGTAFEKNIFYFHWERLNESLAPALRNQVGTIVAVTAHPERTAETSATIDRLFEPRDVQTFTQDERAYSASFVGMFSAVLDVVSILSIVVMLILALILANAIAMGVRERGREYASMRAIGFRPRHVAFVVVAESIIVAFLGGMMGVFASAAFINRGLGKFFEENLSSLFPIFRTQPLTLVMAVLLAVALGAIASILPAFSVSRTSTTTALRRVA